MALDTVIIVGQGTWGEPIVITCRKPNGTAQDISGYSTAVVILDQIGTSVAALIRTGTILSTTGEVSFTPKDGDFDTYGAQFVMYSKLGEGTSATRERGTLRGLLKVGKAR